MRYLLRERNRWLYGWLWLGLMLGVSLGLEGGKGQAIVVSASRAPSLEVRIASASHPAQCPDQLTSLVERMLPDLPSYINRVRTRAGLTKSFIALAAQPEFEPLPLPSLAAPSPDATAGVQQVFFTTLMRRYEGKEMLHLQEYHWLFLARSPQPSPQWQLVLLYSSFGPYPAAHQRPQPPRNSSDGSTATAIRQWLADCQQGRLPTLIRPKPKNLPLPKK